MLAISVGTSRLCCSVPAMARFNLRPHKNLQPVWALSLLVVVILQHVTEGSEDRGTNKRLLQTTQTGYVVAWGRLEAIGTPPITTRENITKITTFGVNALALTAKGEVVMWGDNSWNQTSIPDEARTDVVDIAAGFTHGLVLLRNGSILAWGDNTDGQCNVPAYLKNGSVKATAIAAGGDTSAAIVDGGVKVWGDSRFGQLEVPSDAHSDIVSIAVGYYTVLAQKINGKLVQWGKVANLPAAVQQGALKGHGTFSSSLHQNAAVATDGSIAIWMAGDRSSDPAGVDQVLIPPPNNTPGTYVAVAAGYESTLALTTGGEVVAWGGVLTVPPAARSNVMAISAGSGFGLALVAGSWPGSLPATPILPAALVQAAPTGHAYAWGASLPTQAVSGGIVKISAGRLHMTALTNEGQVLISMLGGEDDTYSLISGIAQHVGTATAIDVSAGDSFTLVVMRDGTVRAWGDNTYKQCDVPDFGGVKVKSVSAGTFHSLALLENGTVVAWGQPSSPDHDRGQAHVPDAAQSNITAIAAGAYGNLAVASGGMLIQWGDVMSDLPDTVKQKGVRTAPGSISVGVDNFHAILTDGTIAVWHVAHPRTPLTIDQVLAAPAGRAVYVAAGYNFSAAVMETGEVVVWGGPSMALTLGPLPTSQALQVAAGQDIAVALLADLPVIQGQPGFVVAWGMNVPNGKLDDDIPIIKASAGAEHVMGLTANGTVRVWGNPVRVDLLDTSLVDGQVVVDIAAGQQHCLALLRNGTVVAWGAAGYDYSQTKVPSSVSADEVVGIAAGYYHSLALFSNGTIAGWGSNASSEIYPPNSTSGNTSAIAAGAYTSFSFSRNSTGLVAWGAAGIVPDTIAHTAVSVAGGLNHSVATLLNGSVIAWMSSSTPSLNAIGLLLAVPATVVNATAVDANSFHSIALLASGQVVTWGAADNNTLTVPAAVASSKVLAVAAGLNFTVAIVEEDPTQVQHLNEATGCASAPNQFGYKCNRVLEGLPGEWHLSYTVSSGASAPNNTCTDGVASAAIHQQLPEGATHWVHFMLSSSALGWIGFSYPEALNRMSPARAILGSTDDRGGSIHTYQLTGYVPPTADTASWAINMGAIKSNDGRSMICFTQAAVTNNSTLSRLQADSSILNLDQDLHFHIASSPSVDTTQKHTMVGAVTLGLTTGNQTVVQLSVMSLGHLNQTNATGTISSGVLPKPGPSSTTGISSGVKAGIAIGGVAAVLAVIGLFMFWVRTTHQRQHAPAWKAVGNSGNAGSNMGPEIEDVAGLLKGDVFLTVAAKKYGWTSTTALHKPQHAIEAGINDTQLDALLEQPAAEASPAPGNCPRVVQLSSQELRENIQLLRDGLLGRGATALVFKCVWPSRFGPNALLAAKVARDASGLESGVLESFIYEANVLSSAQHPNVVRLYGYCIEPPTMCLILELLPYSLKSMLYRGLTCPPLTATWYNSKPSASTSISQNGSQGDSPVQQQSVPSANTSSTNRTVASDDAMVIDVSPADGSVEIRTDKSNTSAGNMGQGGQRNISSTTSEPHSQLTCLQVVRIATDIAAGLAYLHAGSDLPSEVDGGVLSPVTSDGTGGSSTGRSRIVHRDMKPANILINSKGVAKISDFGLARQHEHTTVATVHVGMGTLPYMAPELLLGARAGMHGQGVTNRVDMYSLAMMMWEMLSGCPPWKDMGEMAIFAVVSQRQRPPLPGDMTFKDTAALQEVANQPASPAAIPQLNKLIRACWNQRDLKRPQARDVYAKLMALLTDMQGQQPISTPTVTITSA